MKIAETFHPVYISFWYHVESGGKEREREREREKIVILLLKRWGGDEGILSAFLLPSRSP